MPDQVRLPYHGLCELLQQVIINILVRTYNFSYADAYKKWYKAQIGFDQIVYDIIDGLIKDSDGGIPVLINVSPYIIVIQCTNTFELLGNAKALQPYIRYRKIETIREINYGEIKAYINIRPKVLYNV